jgi:hypothetical protein
LLNITSQDYTSLALAMQILGLKAGFILGLMLALTG